MIHDLTGEIDDMDFVREGKRGNSWNKFHPLSLAARAGGKGGKKKSWI